MPAARHRPLLIAAEGLDGAGKSLHLDLLARWLERKGRSVTTEPWEPSRLLEQAAASLRLRPALTPRVAALLGAADAAARLERDVRPPLAAGGVVLADRYAWTAVAREVARGLEPAWASALYRFAPRPDLVLYFHQAPAAAIESALARRDPSVKAAVVSTAFESFLGRLLEAFESLAAGAAPDSAVPSGPWPVPVLVLDPAAEPPERVARRIRDAVRPLLAGAAAPGVTPGPWLDGGGQRGGGVLPAAGADIVASRPHGQPGRLLVLEGIDGSGRSTHVRLLEDDLRHRGLGVTRTSLATSAIAAEPLRRAKRDRRAGPVETFLLAAADLAERIEQVVGPALRAGLVVLADRYAWTPIARAEARGVDRRWLADVLSFVPTPEAVFLLDVDPGTALERRAAGRIDPYEAGADLRLSADLHESFRLFQARVYASLRRSAAGSGFVRIPTGTVEQVQRRLERAAHTALRIDEGQGQRGLRRPAPAAVGPRP